MFGFVSIPALSTFKSTEIMTLKNPISSYHFQIIVIVY